ncbi:MAG: hypothetical protein CMP23_06710 [Rickettsiales bacterium]|nr:hypothetical protein [Rickettsiales bacterium]|tara:strand:- start:409 stop:621 length:213 start_codon:yes stop_codon:yes gene_type:complete
MTVRTPIWVILLWFTPTLELWASIPYPILVAKRPLPASFLGCLFAVAAVTAVVALGNEAFHFIYKDLGAA